MKSKHTQSLTRFLLATTLMVSPTTVFAQSEAGSGASSLDTIVVTATKRAESLQDVPASVAVLSGERLEDTNIDDLDSIHQLTAGLNIKSEGGPAGSALITLRGVANQAFNVEPRIGILVDHNSIGDFQAISTNLFDIESVQVIRGPQSALFGLNAASGVINIQTAKPGDELNGYVDLEIGNRNTFELQGAVGGPISDTVGVRLAAMATTTDGNLDNIFGRDQGTNTAAVRGRVTYDPTDTASLDLVVSYQDIESNIGFGRVPLDLDLYDALFGVQLDEFETGFDAPGFQDVETFTVGLGGEFDLGFADLAFDVGYRDRDAVDSFDVNGGPGNGLVPEVNFFLPPTDPNFFVGFTDLGPFGSTDLNKIEELYLDVRLSSPAEDRLNWLIGASYVDFESAERGGFAAGFPMPSSIFGVPPGSLLFDQQRTAETYGVYGLVGYDFTDRLSVTAALRYGWAERGLNSESTFFFPNPVEDETSDSDQWIPRVSVDYQVSDDLLLYASVASGWVPAGLAAVASQTELEFNEETVWTYVGGFNFQTADGNLTLNGAAFFSEYSDFQDQVFVNSVEGVFVANADLEVYGFEVDGTYEPIDNLTIIGGVAYAKSEYTDYMVPELGDLAGNQLPLVPEWDYNLAARYEHESGLFIQPELSGATDLFVTAANNVELDGYTIYNLRAGVKFDKYTVTAFVENLTDEEYSAFGQIDFGGAVSTPDFGTGFISGIVAPDPLEGTPGLRRMFGVKLRADF